MVGAIAVLYLARDTFIPLAFAITLALILSPLVNWLQRHRLHRVPAALLVMALAIVLVAGVSFVIFNQLVQIVNELPTYRETITKKVKALKTPGSGSLGRAAENVKELGKELATAQQAPPTTAFGRAIKPKQAPIPVQVVEPPQDVFSSLRDLFQPLMAPVAMVCVVLVFTVFLLAEESDLRNRLLRLVGINRLNVTTQALGDATSRVSRYLLLQFLVNAIFGALCGVGLFFIGVPYAALWGSVAALLRIVPYLGSVTAGLLPLLLCLAVFDGWHEPALVFVLFATLELVTGNFLEPWLYGSNTGISSLALLVTTIFWATLWGPSGLILSTPLTVCVVVLGRHIKQLSFLHVLLGDEPVLAADAQLYQRLLAMDDHEARSVAEEYLRDKSLLNLYDDVILPALALAEQDRHKGALTPEREEFLFLSIREILAEHSELTGDRRAGEQGGRVLCIPAHDEADELAAAMLSRLLEQANRVAITLPLGSSSFELLDLIRPGVEDCFCVSSVPPFAFSHAKNLCQQLRVRFPQTRILAGVWGFSGDVKLAARRFQSVAPDVCVTKFCEALQYLTVETKELGVDVLPAEEQIGQDAGGDDTVGDPVAAKAERKVAERKL